ncbi:MAG: ABC transporter ATP-binding protein [Clostridia bacterium]|nr:ABC transporter ATP-binding protein [Clostridia bacterium]
MLKYLKKYWYAVILAPLLMIVEVYGDLTIPKLVARVIDEGIAVQNEAIVNEVGLKIILLTLLMLVGGVGCAIFASIAGQGFGAELRKDMYKNIQSFSFANINKFKTSSLITRLTNDVTMLEQLVKMGLRMMVRAPIMFVGGIIMAISINARLGLIIAVVLPVMIIIAAIIAKKGLPFFNIVQQKIDRVNNVIRENLIGARVVKVFTREEHEEERFEVANNDLMNTTITGLGIVMWIIPVISLIMNLSIVAVVWVGAKLVGVNGFEVGDITSCITYITQILFSLIMLSTAIMNLARSKASYDRVKEVLKEKSDVVNGENPIEKEIENGEIEFKNVCFAYKDSDGSYILNDLNFKINPGEIVAVLGSTGSGKTTLVNLIPRMFDVSEGEVSIDGINVKDYDLKILRENIGLVLQKNILFSGTIAENMRWGKEDATDEEIEKACEIAQIRDFVEGLPEKYNTLVGQRGVNFSGGQKQRLCIARAIIKKPKILILDDSMSALDNSTENKLREALKKEMKDTTVVMIAQRINTAKNADKIIVLDKTRIVGMGTHDELINKNEVYTEIYNSQMEVTSNG